MTKQAKITIGGLLTAIFILVIALGVSLATRHDGASNNMGGSSDNYMGMMQAMGNMDSDAMLGQMKAILGDNGYQQLQQHMASHRNGIADANGSGTDGMMHQMMDGMMQRMPMDSQNTMPGAKH
jgi:hypothetical protein